MGGLRTAGAGTLTATSVGSEVRLAGWVARRRDHGGVIFIDLRDASGVVQVVIDPVTRPEAAAVAHDVRLEYCVALAGLVRARPEGTINSEMATGEVEVAASEITVLSPSDPLPFQLDDRTEVDETRRLEYRYLDLRRSRMSANLRARSAAIGAIRRTLEASGFLEVETPTLIRSTPEGARDLLVPSRLRPGHFYALPQSPQLFKQLLMIGGVERYYQIARCYRDEDFRSDRQIEFTQLDLEGSFWGRDDVFAAIESAVGAAVGAVRGDPPDVPFPRIAYQEAMRRFGTDKPDLRFGMEIVDLSAIFADTSFTVFAKTLESGGVVRAINAGSQDLARSGLDALVDTAKERGAGGLVWMVVEDDGSPRSPVAKFLGDTERTALIEALGARPDDLLLVVADRERIAGQVLGQFRLDFGRPAGHDALHFTWVIDFPVFDVDDAGELTPSHHPFTAPVDVDQLVNDPAKAMAQSYDLVLNGSELGSGSVRIHDPEVQAKVFSVLGISAEDAERRFGWFLRALRFGTPPHAGFAVGLDRFVSILREEQNIREVMPFPKTQTGFDPLTGSPTPVEEAQLGDLGLGLTAAARKALAAEAEEGEAEE